MDKIRDWFKSSSVYVYINDENDEIVSEHTNGEILFGILGALSALFIMTFITSQL